MKEEQEFIEAEEYQGKNKEASFRSIVLNHLSKISLISTKEFREGYWNKKPTSTGGGVYMSETYIEDTRDSYINAIDFLYDCLLPHFDEDMEKAGKKINKDLDNALKNAKEKKTKKSDWIDDKLLNKRKLFQELNLLLYRLKYLAASKYTQ